MGAGRELSTEASRSQSLFSEQCTSQRSRTTLQSPESRLFRKKKPNLFSASTGFCALDHGEGGEPSEAAPPLTHRGHCPHACLMWCGMEVSHRLFRTSGGPSNSLPLGAGPCPVAWVVLFHACPVSLDLRMRSSWDLAV